MVKCFMVFETSRFRASLRRYALREEDKCPQGGYHTADGPEIGILEGAKDPNGFWSWQSFEVHKPPDTDSRWPLKCGRCDYLFQSQDPFQLFTDHIYVDEHGKEYSLRTPVPGMMWYADWGGDWCKGPDGHSVMVVCPDGSQWCIDGPASNCTAPKDTGPFGVAHRCWVRHGEPPLLTVDKNGKTCQAGAGSIAVPGYHGFLQNGSFT